MCDPAAHLPQTMLFSSSRLLIPDLSLQLQTINLFRASSGAGDVGLRAGHKKISTLYAKKSMKNKNSNNSATSCFRKKERFSG